MTIAPPNAGERMVLASELQARFGGVAQVDIPLSAISQWKVGGKADLIYRPENSDALAGALLWLRARGIRPTVIGMTSNLLFSDRGLRGVVVQIASGCGHCRVDADILSADAGAWVPYVAYTAMRNRLTGIEHICGIPGALGGLLSMNGGSLRRSIAENVVDIDVIDSSGAERTLPVESCNFSYRSSRFQESGEIILRCRLKLDRLDQSRSIKTAMLTILRDRRRFPRKQPNCGSVFVSNPRMYETFGAPGRVIESLGYKSFRVGSASVSPEHANFIINEGGAKARDILEIIGTIRDDVFRSTGHMMRVEARYVTENGQFVSADGLDVLELDGR